MTPIELFILIIFLLLSVPDVCSKIRRPALLYTAYLIVGLLLGGVIDSRVEFLLTEIGRLGFILLLFEIGLEIDIPPARNLLRPVKLALLWAAVQYPLIMFGARWIGLNMEEAFLAAVSLTGCSVSMGFVAWMHYRAPSQEGKAQLLLWMVSLEILAIIILVAGGVVLEEGFGVSFAVRIFLIAASVYLIRHFADNLTRFLSMKYLATTRWRVHYIVLFVFIVAAIGERLGLGAPKTAFFLGLFISRATHEGIALEHHLRPVSQYLLIPIFFVSLGAYIPLEALTGMTAVYAAATAAAILGVRYVLNRVFAASWGGVRGYLLLCPNLTIVAIAASVMIAKGADGTSVSWLLLTGLFISMASIILLPPSPAGPPAAKPAKS